MCGIAGIWSPVLGPEERTDILKSMMQSIRYRGPDGEGIWHDPEGPYSVGHCRLGIVGHARQPFTTPSSVLAVNGEIYNWQHVRRQQEARGNYRFKTDTDIEVLLPLYQEHGMDFVHHVEGMFACSLYDRERKRLLLIRDPFGQKPLYYCETSHGLFFASSVAALREVPGVDLRADLENLIMPILGNFHHGLSPYTVYRGIQAVPYGSVLSYQGQNSIRVCQYLDTHLKAIENADDELRSLIEAVVVQQAAVDSCGVLCSGGLDSSILTSILSQQQTPTLVTAFSDTTIEVEAVKTLSTRYGATMLTQHLSAEAVFREMETLLLRFHEPVCVWSLSSISLCAARAREELDIKVLLSGNGADELFFGYDGHKRTYLASRLAHYFPGIASASRELSVLLEAPGYRKSARYAQHIDRLWEQLPSLDTCVEREEVLHRVSEQFLRASSLTAGDGYLEESNVIGLLLENAHSTMLAGDVPGLIHGVEIRAPFLDSMLVQRVLGLPERKRIQLLKSSKFLLKRLFSEVPALSQKRGLGQVLPACFYQTEFWLDCLAVFARIDPPQNPLFGILLSSLAGDSGAVVPGLPGTLPRITALLWWLCLQEGLQDVSGQLHDQLESRWFQSANQTIRG